MQTAIPTLLLTLMYWAKQFLSSANTVYLKTQSLSHSFGFRAYFTDKARGTVLRLSRDGLTDIGAKQMSYFFQDKLKTNGTAANNRCLRCGYRFLQCCFG